MQFNNQSHSSQCCRLEPFILRRIVNQNVKLLLNRVKAIAKQIIYYSVSYSMPRGREAAFYFRNRRQWKLIKEVENLYLRRHISWQSLNHMVL